MGGFPETRGDFWGGCLRRMIVHWAPHCKPPYPPQRCNLQIRVKRVRKRKPPFLGNPYTDHLQTECCVVHVPKIEFFLHGYHVIHVQGFP